ncbi:MAG TPA: PVC-type heme-binding CxxCH protein [Gemmata sp.]|jgi:putative membrane-bound dehydrogenase-like protein|nr:PVC-type heme-binding CxxCH protein [Gemmata sp.]
MFRIALASLLVAAPAFGAEPTHQVKLNGHTFTLPDGFEIELVAGPPQVERPIVAAFDDKGRLYVCDSSGSNAKTTEQVKTKPHRIVRLESTKGDGKFDKATVFVKNVMFPEGAMWLNGSLYVAAPPHIWKFTDTDDDGVADKEEIWFDGKTLTGCANDLHGPYRGLDGCIYWCKGAFAKQEYELPNGKKFSTRAAHIFRARPDGSHIEPVMTGGMDNPVDVVFTPGGERIFSTTFFQHPGDGKRDGLIHAIYGGVYGKDHDPVYEHPWTSPHLMPVMTHMGPAAPCGLHRYESDQFGKEYENNIFCTQFNMRKVSRHVLVPSGSTFTTKDSDFVVSDNIDFHPTDVIEDADGSLLIMDTGGWYKLCCPTSQLVKPDVLGAIYRVKKTGAHKVADPWGEKINWKKLGEDDLVRLLGDPRPAVQRHAIDQVPLNGLDPVDVARAAVYQDGLRNAVWLGIRGETRKAVPFLVTLADCPAEYVRTIALHGLALHASTMEIHDLTPEGLTDEWVAKNVARFIKDKSLAVRRVAAEALGRMKIKKAIPAILEALADEANDRVLDHSLTYALIEIGDVKATAEGLKHPSPRVRRAVLAALENIPESKLDAKAVLAEVNDKDAALRDTAWWIAGRHPQWGEQLAGYFHDRLAQIEKMTPPEQDELVSRFVPFLKSETVRKTAGDALVRTTDPTAARAILRGLARSGLKTFPAEWNTGVLIALNSPVDNVVRDAIAVLRAVPPTADAFAKLADEAEKYRARLNQPFPKELAFGLRATAPIGLPQADIGELIAGVHRDQPGPVRGAAADVLARAALSQSSLVTLATALKTVNPLEMPKVLQAFTRSTDENVGSALVKSLRNPTVRPTVRAEIVKPILDKYPKAVRDEAEKLYAELAEARKDEQAKLEKLLTELKPGDIRRGQLVFNSQKTQCIACHKVGYVGGLIGPDLTRIGSIRTERDLLEAIVFPSASFVRSYEPMRVLTTDDRTFNGIIKKDAPDEVIIVVAADKEERIARADIASISPSTVSLMPSGLDQQLSQQDLADLIAFLKACK